MTPLDALRKGPFREPAHAWLYEVRNSLGYVGNHRIADALVVSCHPSRGLFLLEVEDPVGPENDAYLAAAAREGMVVAGWGVEKLALARAPRILELLSGIDVYALRVTKGGAPEHPLYLPGTLRPAVYRARGMKEAS